MAAVVTATAAVLMDKARRKRRRRMRKRLMSTRRYWVHPIIQNREERRQFKILYNDLLQHEEKFFNYSQMSVNSFDELLRLLGTRLEYQNTTFRNSVEPAERLLVTLRYLATGNSFASLHYEFKLGKSTVSTIVLRDVVMRKPNKEEWNTKAELFWERCNFPNCVGAIDGKHIRIVRPVGSGTKFFNYKKYFSFVLLAMADANYSFTYIDIVS
ncbi:uncharacterized protein [Aquarana catesbeiana]|uniref:uncharacterized protein n=1 Tax=Aquarana catesbeiana TaxID=8400 RepID=UPI003CC9B79A